MHSTHLRQEHIHGLILGVALGESLGLARRGLSRRKALRRYGRTPLRFRFVPKRGVYSEYTRIMLVNAQGLLNCRSDVRLFRRAFAWRLSWYLLSVPFGINRANLRAGLKAWLMRLGVQTGQNIDCNGAATRTLFSAIATNGTGHRLQRWVEESTRLTHTHPEALRQSAVLAILADEAVTTKPGELDYHKVIERIVEVAASNKEWSTALKALETFLDAGRSPAAVARHFGWTKRIDGCRPMTIMTTYCWLRYPEDFRRATESAIRLGGDSACLGAVVGGLVGSHIGQKRIPKDLRKQLAGNPHGPEWIEELAERFSHWPHGSDDLHLAPAESVDPLMQIIRNTLMFPVWGLHVLSRIPFRG